MPLAQNSVTLLNVHYVDHTHNGEVQSDILMYSVYNDLNENRVLSMY
jgi:hypothetical protein